MKVKYVDLVFENIDVIRLKPEQIEWFYIGGINRNIFFNGIQIIKEVSCNDFTIEIKDPKSIEHLEHGFNEYKTNVLDRLNDNDLTHIDIVYSDGTNEHISIPYTEEQYNAYQHNTYDEESKILKVQASRYLDSLGDNI
ncbi:hypothetical protein CF5_0030 [Staphylococcus phage CF5]|uniref:Uncharacterized protein n=1 Tax=Staphylococcus phage CF5 TaxID=3113739 RepID=A0AAX4J7N5_9CAUD|nr:hypothetical protein CF5_0030 [Staphylococcus phage CF5]